MNLKCTKCMCRFNYTEFAASWTDTSKSVNHTNRMVTVMSMSVLIRSRNFCEIKFFSVI